MSEVKTFVVENLDVKRNIRYTYIVFNEMFCAKL